MPTKPRTVNMALRWRAQTNGFCIKSRSSLMEPSII